MTRKTNARIAGITYLLYIAIAFPGVVLFSRAARGEGIAEKLASIAQHAGDVRIAAVLSLLGGFAALVLAVTLYSITRDEDKDLAMLAMTCRIAEGVGGELFLIGTLGLLWLATATGADAPDPAAAQALAAFLLKARPWNTIISAMSFAVGSTLFCYLLLRGRMIPIPLAWLGVVASVLLVVALPVQLTGLFDGPVFDLVWLPMAVFEIVVAVWFIVKGVGPPTKQHEE